LLRPNRGHYAASSGHHLRSCRDQCNATSVRLLGQIGAITLHQVDVIFSHVGTDATPPTFVYSGQIGALCRVKRTSSSVISGPTQRPRQAFIQAKSRPYAASSGLHLRSYRDRCNAPGVRLFRPNRGHYTASSGLHLRSYQDRRNAPGVRLFRPNRGHYAASSGRHIRSR
jgi:hypothetical protein